MTEVDEILSQNSEHRDNSPIPSEVELTEVEQQLAFRFPAEYREFVRLGGLNDLRFNNRVLTPSEIVGSRRYVPDEFVPFSSNGCGDHYCWERSGGSVFFWDHESGTATHHDENFVVWLRRNRF
jgi:hypothetical protein